MIKQSELDGSRTNYISDLEDCDDSLKIHIEKTCSAKKVYEIVDIEKWSPKYCIHRRDTDIDVDNQKQFLELKKKINRLNYQKLLCIMFLMVIVYILMPP